MFDFALTNKGDFIFVKNTSKQKPLKISWMCSQTNAIKIQFVLRDCQPLTASNNRLKISFNIENASNDKTVSLLYGTEAKAQAFKIRLMSALGEITDRSTIGSLLETVKHKSLFDPNIVSSVSSIVKKAIADISPNAIVQSIPYLDKSIGYSQTMQIIIYEGDTVVLKYDMKGVVI